MHEEERYPYTDEERNTISTVVKAKEEAYARVPRQAYEISLHDLALSSKVHANLVTGGLQSVGEVMERMAVGDEALLMLNGVGVKALQEIKQAVQDSGLSLLEPVDTDAVETVTDQETEIEVAEEAPEREAVAEAAQPEPVSPETAEAEMAPEAPAEPGIADVAEVVPSEVEETPTAGVLETPEPQPEEAPALGAAVPVEAIVYDETEEPELEEPSQDQKRSKGRKRRRTVVFDDTTGETFVVRKRRGRTTDGWDEYSEDY